MKTVLVVDDNDSIREILADALSLEGFEVLTAASGDEALAIVPRVTPSVVLLDLSMPDEDGASVARRLVEAGCTAPVVVATASRSGRTQAESLGAAAFLAKPFDLEQLIEVLGRVLR